jgi:hypothetical protein
MLLYANRPTVRSAIHSNRLVSSLSVVAIKDALVSAQWPLSHNLIATDRDLVANSRGVSTVVTQQSAQPLATLYGFVTTRFRDLRKQQDVGLPLMRPATATPNAPAAIIPARAPRRRLVNAINSPDRPRTGICASQVDTRHNSCDKPRIAARFNHRQQSAGLV